jgi:CBS domain-containing protein
MKVLSRMSSTGNTRLMVVEAGHLAGIVTLKDLLRFLSLKMDLEGDEPEPHTHRSM